MQPWCTLNPGRAGLYKTYILRRRPAFPAGAKSQGKLNDSERGAEGCPPPLPPSRRSQLEVPHRRSFRPSASTADCLPPNILRPFHKPADLALCLQPPGRVWKQLSKARGLGVVGPSNMFGRGQKHSSAAPAPFVMSHTRPGPVKVRGSGFRKSGARRSGKGWIIFLNEFF